MAQKILKVRKMITVRDILVERARRQGLIRQADLHRLAKQVPTHHLTLPRCLRRLLIRFGELLITLGQQLKAREAASGVVLLRGQSLACRSTTGQSPHDEDSMTQPRKSGTVYQIRVKGHLDKRWSDWFNGFVITYPSDDETLLDGRVADQAALHGVLAKIRDLGLSLLSINRVERRE